MTPEPPADTSWLTFKSPTGSWLRRRWTVEHRTVGSPYLDPFNQPEFWSRRRAERYTRKHSCEHDTYTVKPISVCRCGKQHH